MPSADDIQRNVTGAWRMMTGRADGLAMLDTSADGFWNSFLAILLAAPALFVGWSGFASEIAAEPGVAQTRLSLLPRLALVELGVWVLPLVVLGLVARRIGIADRFVPFVVATNWGSVILAWIVVPLLLLQFALPMSEEIGVVLSLAFLMLQLVLSWRLTNIVIGKGAAMGTAVFAGMFVLSIVLLFSLQSLLGIAVPS